MTTIGNLIELATAAPKEPGANPVSIDPQYLKQIKNVVRNGDTAVADSVVQYLVNTLKKRNKVVCLRALIILDELFKRSRLCRDSVASRIRDIVKLCGISMHSKDRRNTSQSSEGSRKRRRFGAAPQNMVDSVDSALDALKNKCLLLLQSWDSMFVAGAASNCCAESAVSSAAGFHPYPSIHAVLRYVQDVSGAAQPRAEPDAKSSSNNQSSSSSDAATLFAGNLQEAVSAINRQHDRSARRTLVKLQLMTQNAVRELQSSLPDIVQTAAELEQLLEVIYPSLLEGEGNREQQSVSTTISLSFLASRLRRAPRDSDETDFSDCSEDEQNGDNVTTLPVDNTVQPTTAVGESAPACDDGDSDADLLWDDNDCDIASKQFDSEDDYGDSDGNDSLPAIPAMTGGKFVRLNLTIPLRVAPNEGGAHASGKCPLGLRSGEAIARDSDSSAAKGADAAGDNVKLVRELSTHLRRFASPRLQVWSEVLTLYLKHHREMQDKAAPEEVGSVGSCSSASAAALIGGNSVTTAARAFTVEVERVRQLSKQVALVREQLENVLYVKVATMLGPGQKS